jgi:hypothetical protein
LGEVVRELELDGILQALAITAAGVAATIQVSHNIVKPGSGDNQRATLDSRAALA